MTREKIQRKQYFFYEKDSRFNPRLIHKSSFLIGQVPIEKYGLKTLFLENRKRFTEVLSPRDQTNPFAYSCSFAFLRSYKNGMIGHGGGGGGTMSNCSKTLYYKYLLETYFVKTCR